MNAFYDLQYGADIHAAGSARLVVDYNASRLVGLTGVASRCAELSDLVAEQAGSFDQIAMSVFPFTAKPQLARDFSAAARLLADGGTVTVRLAEPRLMASIKRELAQHFTHVQDLDKSTILCRGKRPGSGATVPDDIETYSYTDPTTHCTLRLATRPGLFSIGTLDAGTRLLLDSIMEEFDLKAMPSLLDVGCGYGAIGCIAAARGARVTMIDSDCRAVKLARANLAANGLSGTVLVGDAATALPAGPFDLVLSNPPTHAGSARLQRIFDLAANAGTTVRIVVRSHLKYEKLLNGGNKVWRAAERDGYKVIAFERRG